MVRCRLLAGLLGCLAVLVAGLPVVASASAPAAKAVPAAASEPCQHCADCGGAPCQTAMVDCVLACIAAPPALVAAAVTLPAIRKRQSAVVRIAGRSARPDTAARSLSAAILTS